MAAALEEAVGTVCWWGLSPAIDLRLHLPPGAEASVLLVGAAEGRHLLMTAARARRGPPPRHHGTGKREGTPGGAPGRGEGPGVTGALPQLFVAEQSPEPVARQLLFLLLALEAPERPRAAGRAAALLELLGSGSLGPRTAALLRGAAGRLRRWLRHQPDRDREPDREPDRDPSGPADLRLMKCRDRDALEAVLQRWERALPGPGPVPEAEPGRGSVPEAEAVPGPPGWDRRLRRRLGARYESRAAVADWELRMALHPRGATSVSPAEFGRWRESGDAFGGGGATPNPTVLSDPRPRADGRSVSPPAYWGDTVTGPFLSFGLDPAGLRSPPQDGHRAVPGRGHRAAARAAHRGAPRGPPRAPGPPPRAPGPPPRGPPRGAGPPPVRIAAPWGAAVADPRLGALAAPGATLLLELPTFVPALRPPQLAAFRARAVALARAGGFEPWGGPGEPPAHARFRRPPPR
ncbi:dynein axonemal assembly factor 3-like isoform X1 [Passer domesticus]|uniref:dynein axonemal assembly factor 3-like isoform X1 n=1 Tax=Passer domesticus TaxID=48849 RepID=UPI0030FF0ADF